MGNQIPKLNQLILPTHLITNIKSLFGILENQQEAIRGAQLAQINHIDDAFLFVENGRVKDYGPMSECPELNVQHIDATGKFVLPSWCDSHTHLVLRSMVFFKDFLIITLFYYNLIKLIFINTDLHNFLQRPYINDEMVLSFKFCVHPI